MHLAAWLPPVALVVCTVAVVAASETTPDAPRVDGASGAEQSPRYLRHDEQIARPLPAETQQAAPPFAETLVPRLRATERLTSGESGEAHGPSRPAGAANREIPLSRPTSQEPDSQRGSEMPPLATGAASLGIVLGLFLVVVWAVRRGLPKGAGMLPSDVIEVLGRAPLVDKQNVHLIRCGSKLLLVCIAPGSVQTLTEITDPDEVERLTGLCQTKRGPTASFRATLAHFGGKQPVSYFSEQQVEEMNFGAFESNVAGSRVRAQ
jgi:flagellar biogenesis protein FliO